MQQKIIDLYDTYTHGGMSRRSFIDRLAMLVGGTAAATALLPILENNYAHADTVAESDPRVKGEMVTFKAGSQDVSGYLVRPAADGKYPSVLVVHENRGLNPHIEDVARRVALADFVAFAPDALAPLGGYPGDEEKARALFPKLDQAKTREDFVAAVNYLKGRPDSTGKVGVVGFCYGGGIANLLATRIPDLGGAVPFYGGQPAAEQVPNIKAPLLIHYAENDERINAAWPAYETALKAAKVRYEAYIYPGTQHGFNNDTTPRFDEAAAKLAWTRTIEFFNKNLRG
jgi:carboxymethylenebutenolidase